MPVFPPRVLVRIDGALGPVASEEAALLRVDAEIHFFIASTAAAGNA
ncbi:hypothetical protein CfE428DRAFT_1259 [Chthoniobacter flavus Ellin428]|uniref:Uncharacterized protein n=1 Tax=Chthoniobacter flavus Ellin428 TaxID=497964 RepID=B4CXG8_9BACT|nr:hypothetical protein CfE428DRAFT_1259 [Chthoniobacter flavus Ellin428]